MKKPLLIALFSLLTAQNLYFEAFKNVNKAKKIIKTQPQKADKLFIQAYGYLKQYINNTIEQNKPSANSFKLLGEMYLNGWGVEKDIQKAQKLLCAAKKLGNIPAKNLIIKSNISCPKQINFKELKQ